jgi:hydrogenase nickel incorporation protein HypA/HybF
MAEALMGAFDIVKLGTLAEGARLIITRIPLGGLCRSCGRDFDAEEAFILACPHCGGPDFSLERGRELHVTQIEVN